MSTIKPANEPGFIIEQNDTTKELTFILQPGGNVRTPRQVLDDNETATPVVVPIQKTVLQSALDIADRDNEELTDADDVLGESAYAELSIETIGPQQTDISDSYVQIDQFDTVGISNNITISAPNNNLTVTKDGFYSIEYYMSFLGSANQIYFLAVHVNDAEIKRSVSVRTVSAANDVGNISNKVIMQLSENDIVEIRVKTFVAGSNDFELQAGNFIIQKVR